MHKFYDGKEAENSPTWLYEDASKAAVDSVMDATKDKKPPCNRKCIEAQVNGAHAEMGIGNGTTLRASKYGPAPLAQVPQGTVAVQPRPS